MPLTLNSTGVAVVDDSNATIVYQGSWFLAGSQGEFNSTTHGTALVGSTATFLFNGTAAAVYGTLGAGEAVISTYAIDDSSAVTFTAPVVQAAQYQTLFYQSPTLQDGQHRLVIILANNDSNTLWLDYLLYQPSQVTSLPLTTSSLPPTNSAGVPSSTNSTSGHDGSPVGITGKSIGAIVGGTLGGLLLLAAIIIALLYYKRRRRPVKHREDILGLDDPNVSAWEDPFPSESHHLVANSARHPSSQSLPVYGTPAVDSTYQSNLGEPSEAVGQQLDPRNRNGPLLQSTKQRPSMAGSRSNLRFHQDGGVRITEGQRHAQHSAKTAPTPVDSANNSVSSRSGHSRSEVAMQNGDQQISADSQPAYGGSFVGGTSEEQLLSPRTIVDLPPAYRRY